MYFAKSHNIVLTLKWSSTIMGNKAEVAESLVLPGCYRLSRGETKDGIAVPGRAGRPRKTALAGFSDPGKFR